jgi:hypothetical protein
MKKNKIVFKASQFGIEYKAVLKEDASIDECLDAIENLLRAMTFDEETIGKAFLRKANQYEK